MIKTFQIRCHGKLLMHGFVFLHVIMKSHIAMFNALIFTNVTQSNLKNANKIKSTDCLRGIPGRMLCV